MPDRPLPGRSLVSRRAVIDIVRAAVVGSYGVIGVEAGPVERLLGRLGVREPGMRVRLDRGIEVELHLVVGYGLPIAEVARQVDSAVRYAIHHALGHEVQHLTVHVGGLRYQPASLPPVREPYRGSPPEPEHDAPIAEPRAGVGGDGADAATGAEAASPEDGRDGREPGRRRPRRRRSPAGRVEDG